MSKLCIFLIHCYRRLISPFLPKRCRFELSCSKYALYAFECHGFWKGFFMVLKRLSRCHPYAKNVENSHSHSPSH